MDRKLIYNAVANKITEYDSNVYISQRYELIPRSIPCVFVQQISKVRTRRFADLSNTDNQYRLTFEVQVFEKSMAKMYALMETVENTFKELSFFEEMCEPIDNADMSVCRMVARFSAQLGGTI